jgi:hypothetical protein
VSILSIVLIAQELSRSAGAQFPVPRAQVDFAALGPHVRGYCHAIEGDPEAFRRAVLPFGPMDLAVTKGTRDESVNLRNLYLGFVGALCKIDAGAFAQSFRCGSPCTSHRKKELQDKLPSIKELIVGFRKLRGIGVISQWGISGEYRLDNVFVMMGQAKETRPSPQMGFVPSDSWSNLSGAEAYLQRVQVSAKAFGSVMSRLKNLSLAAVVKEDRWCRVIGVGIGTNESGLIFLNERSTLPKIGDVAGDGRRYVTVQSLEDAVAFYETE